MKVPLTILLVLQATFGICQNPFWVFKDKKLISSVTVALEDQEKLKEIFEPKTRIAMNNLGFGYAMISTTEPGGYISLHCTFYYYKDSLISYAVYPELPSDSNLTEKYLNWYKDGFQIDSIEVTPYYHNIGIMRKPLKQFGYSYSTNHELLFYSSPESGITYGDKDGLPLSYLQNRKAFLDLENSLDKESVIQLLYSKNPASRLTAIEYYYKNKALFTHKKEIEAWIEVVFNEVPYVSTLTGCIGTIEKSRKLVDMFVKSVK